MDCPTCLSERAKQDNRVVTLFPDLIEEWHPTKNADINLESLTYGTNKMVWWKCKEGHEFPTRVSDRTKYRIGCSYCTGYKPTKDNNLGVLFPDIAKQWHPTKNKDLTPHDVTSKSGKKVWWQCEKGHDYQISIFKKTRGYQCPTCKKEKK